MKKANSLDFDALWKEFFSEFLQDSIAMLNPRLHDAVDWSVPPVHLEQELFNALKGKYKIKNKRKFTDKLVKLSLKSGKEHLVLLHAEAQHEPEDDFNKRMYVYRSLIFLRYDIEDITAIAIFTGAPPDASTLIYHHEIFETELIYKFKSYVCVQQNEAELLKSDNPFAIATLAAMYAYQTRNAPKKRFTFKQKLFNLANQKNIPFEKLVKTLIFVRDLIHLTQPLENEFAAKDSSIISKTDDMYTFRTSPSWKVVNEALFGPGKDIDDYTKLMQEAEKTMTELKEAQAKIKEAEAIAKDVRATVKEAQAKTEAIEAEREQSIWNLYSEIGLSEDKIAKAMNLELEYVQKIIAKKQKANK